MMPSNRYLIHAAVLLSASLPVWSTHDCLIIRTSTLGEVTTKTRDAKECEYMTLLILFGVSKGFLPFDWKSMLGFLEDENGESLLDRGECLVPDDGYLSGYCPLGGEAAYYGGQSYVITAMDGEYEGLEPLPAPLLPGPADVLRIIDYFCEDWTNFEAITSNMSGTKIAAQIASGYNDPDNFFDEDCSRTVIPVSSENSAQCGTPDRWLETGGYSEALHLVEYPKNPEWSYCRPEDGSIPDMTTRTSMPSGETDVGTAAPSPKQDDAVSMVGTAAPSPKQDDAVSMAMAMTPPKVMALVFAHWLALVLLCARRA